MMLFLQSSPLPTYVLAKTTKKKYFFICAWVVWVLCVNTYNKQLQYILARDSIKLYWFLIVDQSFVYTTKVLSKDIYSREETRISICSCCCNNTPIFFYNILCNFRLDIWTTQKNTPKLNWLTYFCVHILSVRRRFYSSIVPI